MKARRFTVCMLAIGSVWVFVERAFSYYDYQERTTVVNENWHDPWATLETQKPWLASWLKFFNPRFLSALGPLGLGVTLLVGMGALVSAFGFEGTPRVLLFVLALYCFGHLVSQFVVISLVGQGVLAP